MIDDFYQIDKFLSKISLSSSSLKNVYEADYQMQSSVSRIDKFFSLNQKYQHDQQNNLQNLITLLEKHWFKNLKSNNIFDKSSQIIFSGSIAKTFTTRQLSLSKHELICKHNMSLIFTINHSYIFLILNLISCWHIFHKVNDFHKNTTAIERIKLSNKISHFRIQYIEMINWLCQLQSNF